MIICHCTNITSDEIIRAVDWMRAADPYTLITPGKIYRALGKRADCGGCVSLFVETMRSSENLPVPGRQDDLPVPILTRAKSSSR